MTPRERKDMRYIVGSIDGSALLRFWLGQA